MSTQKNIEDGQNVHQKVNHFGIMLSESDAYSSFAALSINEEKMSFTKLKILVVILFFLLIKFTEPVNGIECMKGLISRHPGVPPRQLQAINCSQEKGENVCYGVKCVEDKYGQENNATIYVFDCEADRNPCHLPNGIETWISSETGLKWRCQCMICKGTDKCNANFFPNETICHGQENRTNRKNFSSWLIDESVKDVEPAKDENGIVAQNGTTNDGSTDEGTTEHGTNGTDGTETSTTSTPESITISSTVKEEPNHLNETDQSNNTSPDASQPKRKKRAAHEPNKTGTDQQHEQQQGAEHEHESMQNNNDQGAVQKQNGIDQQSTGAKSDAIGQAKDQVFVPKPNDNTDQLIATGQQEVGKKEEGNDQKPKQTVAENGPAPMQNNTDQGAAPNQNGTDQGTGAKQVDQGAVPKLNGTDQGTGTKRGAIDHGTDQGSEPKLKGAEHGPEKMQNNSGEGLVATKNGTDQGTEAKRGAIEHGTDQGSAGPKMRGTEHGHEKMQNNVDQGAVHKQNGTDQESESKLIGNSDQRAIGPRVGKKRNGTARVKKIKKPRVARRRIGRKRKGTAEKSPKNVEQKMEEDGPNRSGTDHESSALKWSGTDQESSALKWRGTDQESSALKWSGTDQEPSPLKWRGTDQESSPLKWRGTDQESSALKWKRKNHEADTAKNGPTDRDDDQYDIWKNRAPKMGFD